MPPPEPRRAQVALALDVPDRTAALALDARLGEGRRIYKVGLELFTAEGPPLVRELLEREHRIFLDLKLHDIPNTVARAVESAARLGVHWLTVHTAGGPGMLSAAARAERGALRLVGVTVLTSLDAPALATVLGRPGVDVQTEVDRRAGWAREAGLEAVVCSVAEAARLKDVHGPALELVTPGIRFADQGTDDQARVATPAGAVRAGADLLVIGRAVTAAADPRGALARVLAETEAAGAVRA
ncbi:MAG: orotidine-5'-phosphate decarboxylase [Gemmatimonadota bacterium]